jgi:hypothetical protein
LTEQVFRLANEIDCAIVPVVVFPPTRNLLSVLQQFGAEFSCGHHHLAAAIRLLIPALTANAIREAAESVDCGHGDQTVERLITAVIAPPPWHWSPDWSPSLGIPMHWALVMDREHTATHVLIYFSVVL